MDRRIDELREKLQAWIETEFQPAFVAAGDAANRARSDEMRVRRLNGSIHSKTRSVEDSWGRHVGLWAIAQALEGYGESPAAWAWKRAR